MTEMEMKMESGGIADINAMLETRRERAEKIAAAIEQSILALIAGNVHMNHRYDTLANAHKNLVETLMQDSERI